MSLQNPTLQIEDRSVAEVNFLRPFLEGAINGTPLTARWAPQNPVTVGIWCNLGEHCFFVFCSVGFRRFGFGVQGVFLWFWIRIFMENLLLMSLLIRGIIDDNLLFTCWLRSMHPYVHFLLPLNLLSWHDQFSLGWNDPENWDWIFERDWFTPNKIASIICGSWEDSSMR